MVKQPISPHVAHKQEQSLYRAEAYTKERKRLKSGVAMMKKRSHGLVSIQNLALSICCNLKQPGGRIQFLTASVVQQNIGQWMQTMHFSKIDLLSLREVISE